MFRNCAYCDRNFKLFSNPIHVAFMRRRFCSRRCKELWNQKFNFKVRKAHTRANLRYSSSPEVKLKKHNYYKSTYVPHPRRLLTEFEKRQRIINYHRLDKSRRRNKEPLTLDIIQSVYEHNILTFSTLMCTYCYSRIKFGDDTLDHVLPICKGGGNEFDNLVIACAVCNNQKNTRTPQEWFSNV